MPLFNVRVYGVLIDQENRLLVSDEFIRGEYITKLPGGGLEFGEGTIECLIREFKEETDLTVTVEGHLYTTDFFQISAFNHKDQIISIYYHVNCNDISGIKTSIIPFDFSPEQTADTLNGVAESFRWINLSMLDEHSMTLPIDKVAILKLKEKITS